MELADIIYMPDTEIGLKASRYQCYQSRDRYLECCDKYEARSDSKCKKLKEKFEQDCPASWVTHFIRKHNYEKYKQKLVDQGILLTDLDNAEKVRSSSSSS